MIYSIYSTFGHKVYNRSPCRCFSRAWLFFALKIQELQAAVRNLLFQRETPWQIPIAALHIKRIVRRMSFQKSIQFNRAGNFRTFSSDFIHAVYI